VASSMLGLRTRGVAGLGVAGVAGVEGVAWLGGAWRRRCDFVRLKRGEPWESGELGQPRLWIQVLGWPAWKT
jgi:hypothetical protein